jgi:hypothetical protein
MAYELPNNLNLVNEDSVNGLWNSILGHYYFPYPDYIIKPEGRIESVRGANLRFADLVVCDPNGVHKLVFEGKRHGLGDITKADAIQQATAYAQGCNVRFAIVASGREVTFLQVDNQGSAVLVPPGTTFAGWIDMVDKISMVDQRLKYIKMMIEMAH